MKVGDLVIMPGQPLKSNEAEPVAVVLLLDSVMGVERDLQRAKVYWIQDEEIAWEPQEWMEVISASR